jgi:hypothetical protein
VVVTSRGEGDSFFAVFPSPVSAVEAAGAASFGWRRRRGRRVLCCGCGWGCIPAKRVCAGAAVSTTRRSTAVPG